jgi:hypothetical protein
MAKQQKKKKSGAEPHSVKKRSGFLVALVVLGVVAAVAVAVFFLSGERRGPLSKQAATADYQALKGRWVRPDGGYILEIRSINPDGTLDARYFNPRPINVSRAEVSPRGQAASLFVELRDTGYPGCTYTLLYDPGEDSLKGIYYQAAVRESFEIIFVRMR